MDEQYYYVEMTPEQIEEKLLYSVVCNRPQALTGAEKAQFRENIGAGKDGKGLVILGYFNTLADMQASLLTLPQPGDAYGIGTQAPYDIYIYDGPHDRWVNNGPITVDNTIIDDETTSRGKTWSSYQIDLAMSVTALTEVSAQLTDHILIDRSGTKRKALISSIPISASGLQGKIARSQLNQDCLYSPVKSFGVGYTLTIDDIGYTLYEAVATANAAAQIILSKTVSDNMPAGAEIAVLRLNIASSVSVTFPAVNVCIPGEDTLVSSPVITIPEKCTMIALKKLTNDLWAVFGDVEVVSS